MPLLKFLHNFYRSLAILVLILIASTLPSNEVEKITWFDVPNFDKLVHLGMYFSLAFVLIFDIMKAKPDVAYTRIFLLAAVLAVFYGGSLEILQATLTDSRSGDFADLAFNTVGVLLAVLAWVVLKKLK